MNPFVKYTLAVAMGASTTQALAEVEDTAPVDQSTETTIELTAEQQAALDNLQAALDQATAEGKSDAEISAIIAAAVTSNPELAAAITTVATNTNGVSASTVTTAVVQGLSEAPATAAGPSNSNANPETPAPANENAATPATPAVPGSTPAQRATPSPRSGGGGGGTASGG
jgi:multidrug efflux pump subunit AcrB